MNTCQHTDYLSKALELAQKGRLTVSPNPMVGCIIVKNGEIVGQGYHQRAGEAHAEIHALRQAGLQAKDATVYLTLEPCAHTGKTPPCVTALIEAGVKKVYIATLDPNPLVNGNGVSALQSAGIDVNIGLLQSEAQALNNVFFHYMTHKRPFIIAKWAMSLDGKTIAHPQDDRNISSSASQQSAHALRQQVDAILVGANTAKRDNPQLTARLASGACKQPIRIILATKDNLPRDLKLFDPDLPGRTIIATTESTYTSTQHVEILILPKNIDGHIDLHSLLDELGKREITSLLVEGGMTVHHSFIQEKLINQFHVYLAPVIIGSLEKKMPVNALSASTLSTDIFLTAEYHV